ncbi:energy coupling factor transporter S component ThiW [Staphylococcus pseudintermedius]|nr:energy coupling factor transporter S component ThiW [Staphylococcus pseudintermedius]
MNTRKLTLTALFIAVNVVLSTVIVIPLGAIKAAPVQHFVNVLSVVILGPWYGLAQAFLSSCIRVMFGTGTPFAFPGSMIGASISYALLILLKRRGVLKHLDLNRKYRK